MGARVGRVADEDMVRLNRAVLVFLFLGIAAPSDHEQPAIGLLFVNDTIVFARRVRFPI
jgi:hypothetical protein